MCCSRNSCDLPDSWKQCPGIVTFAKRVSGSFAFQFICKITDLLKVVPQFLKIVRDRFFDISCSHALFLNTGLQPIAVCAETVQPVAGGDKRFDERVQAEITKEHLDLFITGPDLLADRFTRSFACKIETALFIQDGKRRIDSSLESMFAEKQPAKPMDCGYRRCRQQSNRFRPLPGLRIKRRSDSVAHLGCGLFRKGHSHDAQRIDAAIEQFEVHLHEFAGFSSARAREYNSVLIKRHQPPYRRQSRR